MSFVDTQGQLIHKRVGPSEMGMGFGKLPDEQMGETIVWKKMVCIVLLRCAYLNNKVQ